jgi:hypothetical protein
MLACLLWLVNLVESWCKRRPSRFAVVWDLHCPNEKVNTVCRPKDNDVFHKDSSSLKIVNYFIISSLSALKFTFYCTTTKLNTDGHDDTELQCAVQ